MSRFRSGLICGLILIAGVLLGVAVVTIADADTLILHITGTVDDTHATMTDARADLLELRKKVESYSARVDSTSRAFEDLLRRAALAAQKVDKSADRQTQYWDDTSKQVTATVSHLDSLVQHTDASINQQMLPAVTHTVEQVMAGITAATDSISSTTAELRPVLDSAALQLSNPAIASSLGHIDIATANIQSTTAHTDQTAADLERYAKTLTTPARGIWRVLKALEQVLAPFVKGSL